MKQILIFGFILCALNIYGQKNKINFFLNPIDVELSRSFQSTGNRSLSFSHKRQITPEFGVVYDRIFGDGKWGIGAGLSLKKFKNSMDYTYEVWGCNAGLDTLFSRESKMEVDAWGLRLNGFYNWGKLFIKGILEVNSPFDKRIKTTENNFDLHHILICDLNSSPYQVITVESLLLRPSGNPYHYSTQEILLGYRLTEKINITLGVKARFRGNERIFYLELYDNKNEDDTFSTIVSSKKVVEVKNKFIMGYLGFSYDLYFGKEK